MESHDRGLGDFMLLLLLARNLEAIRGLLGSTTIPRRRRRRAQSGGVAEMHLGLNVSQIERDCRRFYYVFHYFMRKRP